MPAFALVGDGSLSAALAQAAARIGIPAGEAVVCDAASFAVMAPGLSAPVCVAYADREAFRSAIGADPVRTGLPPFFWLGRWHAVLDVPPSSSVFASALAAALASLAACAGIDDALKRR